MVPPMSSFMVFLFQLIGGGKCLEQKALVSPISSTELYDIDSIVSTKILLFKV